MANRSRRLLSAVATSLRLALRFSDFDGENRQSLTEPGRNLIPSRVPNSKHVVWMITEGGGDTSGMSEIHLMNTATFHVWAVSEDGKARRKSGRGDDPTWSPDGFLTRVFPDQRAVVRVS